MIMSKSSPMTEHKDYRRHNILAQLKHGLAGAVSATLTRAITHPLDVIRIRFQLQVEPIAEKKVSADAPKSKYTSMTQAVRLIYHEEGIRSFWKGHMAGQMISISYGIFQFWAYEQLHVLAEQTTFFHSHPNFDHFISGAISGCFASTLTMPFDVLRTRLVAQDHNSIHGYTGVLNGMRRIARKEGVQGLFRGLGPTLLQNGPLIGANFMFFKSFNVFAAKLFGIDKDELSVWCLLITAGAAGATSKMLFYPLDFIKKRMQMQKFEKQRQTFGRHTSCTSIMNCFLLTIREEGFNGFYKGFSPTIIRTGVTSAFYFSLYEAVKKYLNESVLNNEIKKQN